MKIKEIKRATRTQATTEIPTIDEEEDFTEEEEGLVVDGEEEVANFKKLFGLKLRKRLG